MKLRSSLAQEAFMILTLLLLPLNPRLQIYLIGKFRAFVWRWFRRARRWFRRNRQSILRFLTIGAVSRFLIQTPVLYLVTEKLHIHYLTSSFIAVGASVAFVYLGSKYWAFADSQRHHIVVAPEDAL